ncbi:MAG: DUF4199 domain-containing protein [Holophagales bacterium]|nr:DUF4199 domain-containing protein [Holophagales bacterium]
MLLNLVTGLLVGLGSTGLLYVLHFQGLLREPLGERLWLGAMLIHAVGLLVALWRHRGSAGNEADVPFSRLFGAGLAVSFVAGAVAAQGAWLFVGVVDPSYLDWLRQSSLDALAAQAEMDAAERSAQEAAIAAITPARYAVQVLMGTLFTGFFLSLTLSALMRVRVLRTQSRSA